MITDKWYLKITSENYKLVRKVRKAPGTPKEGFISPLTPQASNSHYKYMWSWYKPEGYTEINTDTFKREVLNMKEELTKLPKYWCVKNDHSQLFEDTVIKYLHDHYNNYTPIEPHRIAFFGVASSTGSAAGWFLPSYFGDNTIELTLDEFIRLTSKTNNMTTDKPQSFVILSDNPKLLEAIWDDLIKIGYTEINDYYNPTTTNKPIEGICVNNLEWKTKKEFLNLFVGKQYVINPFEDFQAIFKLPAQYTEALEFAKAQFEHPYWKKEDDFKVGDIVVTIKKGSNQDYKSEIGEMFEVVKIGDITKILYFNSCSAVSADRCRKATPEEIEKFNNPIVTLKFGTVKFKINKKEGYATTDYGRVTKEEIKAAIDYIENPPKLAGYTLTIHPIKNQWFKLEQIDEYNPTLLLGFGCKSGKFSELKAIYNAFE